MTVAELAQIAAALLLTAAAIAAILIERVRSRWVLNALYQEVRGLCREAAELGEAICAHEDDGRPFDEAFMDHYALSEPHLYAALAPALWRLPGDVRNRVIEFHGTLSPARTRFAAWRAGSRRPVSTYLLLSALTRSVDGVEPLARHITRQLGWPQSGWLKMPLASKVIERVENTNPDYLDRAYWLE